MTEFNVIKEIIERSGMSVTDISRELQIPTSTINGWITGRSKCPDYVVTMFRHEIERILDERKQKISELGREK